MDKSSPFHSSQCIKIYLPFKDWRDQILTHLGMKIEVCINRFEDVIAVQSLGIDRIELCIELGCGGLTPSLAMVAQALAVSKVPIHVLVRPRSGDFYYTKATIEAMKVTIKQLLKLGVSGIVTGGLSPKQKLPLETLKSFRKIITHEELYFHRAFDEVKSPKEALETLIDLGFDGVLTAGQAKTALEGMPQLIEWRGQAKDRLTILPGSGINASNCLEFADKGFDWVHLSSTKRVEITQSSYFSKPHYQLDVPALTQVISLLKP